MDESMGDLNKSRFGHIDPDGGLSADLFGYYHAAI